MPGNEPLVIDASIATTWILEDESHAVAEAILDAVISEGVGVVTRHWHLEVRNALLMSERRGRIMSENVGGQLSFLNRLPLQTDTEANIDTAFDLARLYNLTMYDAMYLELALRIRLPLATLDRGLSRAASVAGVEVLP